MTPDTGTHPAPKPLASVTVLELGGIGPGPFAGMMLADLGATVTRIDRSPEAVAELSTTHGALLRGRTHLSLDLKADGAADTVLDLMADADIVIEGFRPGVAERLGLGPDTAHARNPALVYGRMTGWGQDGPLAQRAGHDITYLALSGALEPVRGQDGLPTPPLNLLGDFGGGGMLLVAGVLAALTEARATGKGTVVDAAIVDGVALMTGMLHAMKGSGLWAGPPGANAFDGGAPHYRVYRTADDRFVAVGALEPAFLNAFLEGIGLTDPQALADIADPSRWPQVSQRIADIIATRTRDEWVATFDGVDACVAPVLTPEEAAADSHLTARGTYRTSADGQIEPAPAPRFLP